MANPTRGEVDFEFINDRSYTLKFNNAAKRNVEANLDMPKGEIVRTLLGADGEADNIRTILFFQATRKHHAQDFKSIQSVDAFMDEFEDACEDAEDGGAELRQEFIAAILSAYLRRDKDRFKAMLRGEYVEEDEEPNGSNESPKATGKAKSKTETEAQPQ